MKTTLRTLGAVAALLPGAAALAHPGHEAPPMHAHDFEEAIAMAAVVLVAAVIVAGVVALRRSKARLRRGAKP